MDAAVLFLWVLTALGGVVLAFRWARAGGTRMDDADDEAGIRTGLLAPHVTLAVTGLAFWMAYAIADDDDQVSGLRWLSLALLVPAMAIGYAHGLLALATLAGVVVASNAR